jgi:hypothetical protein
LVGLISFTICRKTCERPVAEEERWQDRLARAPLDEHERRQQHDRQHHQDDRLARVPGERRAAEAREQDDAREPTGEQRRADVVDVVLHATRARVEDGADDDERKRADRQVDVEDPAPRQVVDEEPAEQRADHGRHAEHSAEHALVPSALARRDDVADDRDRRDEQAAGAEAL